MKEIEIKILEIDKIRIIEKIKELNAVMVFDGELVNTYFDYEDCSLEKKGKHLRLREKGKNTEITLKENFSKVTAKIADEYKITFLEREDAKKILAGMGLVVNIQVRKYRTSFHLGDIAFEIDEIPGIPPLLEIEAPDMDTIEKYVKYFGYNMSDAKPWSFREVMQYYKKDLSA